MKILRKSKFIVVLLLFVVPICYVSNEYKKYDKFLGEKFPDDFSFNLGSYFLSYVNDFEVESFDNQAELERLNIWLNNNFMFSDYERDLISYGYSIKELPNKNLYLFCLNGPDRKSSDENISKIKSLELDRHQLIEEPSFIQFLFGYNDFDIALFAIDK